jgi:hypothetical protein
MHLPVRLADHRSEYAPAFSPSATACNVSGEGWVADNKVDVLSGARSARRERLASILTLKRNLISVEGSATVELPDGDAPTRIAWAYARLEDRANATRSNNASNRRQFCLTAMRAIKERGRAAIPT